MNIQYFKVPSNDSVHELNCKLYVPVGKPKGILQLVHGMCEHIERYDEFLKTVCSNGYICVTHDHLGHGETVNDDSELGFIKHKNGWLCLVEDIHNVSVHIKKLNPELPIYLLGHSMGSFCVRLYAAKYKGELNGLIIMGTGAANAAAGAGILITLVLCKTKGERYVSPFVYNMAFGGYTKRFSEPSPHSWLSNDTEVMNKYAADKKCTFSFCVSAMKDLITLNRKSGSKKYFKEFDKNLPTLLVSGECDPVGDYGKGVKKVEKSLKDTGVKRVECIIYKNARHEILNDFCKEKVTEDILKFIDTLDNTDFK